MIKRQSVVSVADNSGVNKLRCISVQGGFRPRSPAVVGDVIRASVQSSDSTSKFRAGDRVLALVVRTKLGSMESSGYGRRFPDNAVILVNSKGEPIGSRRFGPVPRSRRPSKVLSRAPVSV